MFTISFRHKKSSPCRFKFRIALFIFAQLFIFALLVIFGHDTATARSLSVQPSEWFEIDVKAVDVVEIELCADRRCSHVINRLSAALCTPSKLVCNFAIPNDHYEFACTGRSCLLRRPFGDTVFYRLRIYRNGQVLTSDIEQAGKNKVVSLVSAESGWLGLSESQAGINKHSQLWKLWAGQDDQFFRRWPLIPIIEVLIFFVIFGFWRKWTATEDSPRIRFWLTVVFIQLIVYFAYALLFNASKPIILLGVRTFWPRLIPIVVVYLFVAVWFYHSAIRTWLGKVPIAIGITILMFGYFIVNIILDALSQWGGGGYEAPLLPGLSLEMAFGLVLLVAVLLEAYLYRKLERQIFTSESAFYMSLLTNCASFAGLLLMSWFNL